MKVSNAISATAAATTDPAPTGRSSASPLPSLTKAEEIALTGPSRLPDPEYTAYRHDLADLAVAGQVIASYYVDPLQVTLKSSAHMLAAPSDGGQPIAELAEGAPFRLLEDKLGWAWGYGGSDGRVGYIPSEALGLA